MTEKLNSEDLLELEPLQEPETSVPPSQAEAAAAEEEVHDRNEVDEDEEKAFLRDALGGSAHAEEAQKLNRETEITASWDDKPVNPQNKPMHPSVTEKYFTEGGKEVKAVHDEVGSLWHIEFGSGGQLPKELSGSYTDEKSARQAIKIYLAKRAD